MQIVKATAFVKGGTLLEITKRFKEGDNISNRGKIVTVEQIGDGVKIVFEALSNMIVAVFGIISDTFLGRCSLNTQAV